MSNWPFRFLHTSDFHLEMPPVGLPEVPEHLVELLLDAPYHSVQRVFETALAEAVDFVLLAGDIVHARQAGPRGPVFLLEQFERLAERGIAVYWSPGEVDPPEGWPPALRLPGNVHVFGGSEPQEQLFRREDSPVARIRGAGRPDRGCIHPAAFEPAEPGLFTIALVHGQLDARALEGGRIDYWALGGEHARATLREAMPVVHYPGSPQGRRPSETGPHGCTLVEVDPERNVRLASVATDVVRWHDAQVAIDAQTSRDALEAILDRRVAELAAASTGGDALICWRIHGVGPLLRDLGRGPLAEAILKQLREKHGHGSPALWSVSLSAEPDMPAPPDWYRQDTIRGDFLRRVAELAEDAAQPLGIEGLAPADALPEEVGWIPEGEVRGAVLREVALLGADLLTGEEPDS